MSNIPNATAEDKAIQKIVEVNGIRYNRTPKYMEWERLYLDKKSKETYLNATQSAIKAYNLDPIRQYDVAGQIGSANVKKHQDIIGKYYRSKGKTEETLWDLYWQMMLAKKDVNMLNAIAKTMGVPMPQYEPGTNPQYVLAQQNNNINVTGDMSLTFTKEENKEVTEGEVIDEPADAPQS